MIYCSTARYRLNPVITQCCLLTACKHLHCWNHFHCKQFIIIIVATWKWELMTTQLSIMLAPLHYIYNQQYLYIETRFMSLSYIDSWSLDLYWSQLWPIDFALRSLATIVTDTDKRRMLQFSHKINIIAVFIVHDA